MIAGDRVSVTVTVAVPPARAFAAFTEEIDLWWRRGLVYRVAGRKPGTLVLEPRAGGRLFEQYEGARPGEGPRTHEVGRITIWEPPRRLAFEWRGANFQVGEVTLVAIAFTPTESGTRLDLVHSGFAALRPEHPVRHGEAVPAFVRRLGMWWGDLLAGLHEHL